MTKLLFGYKRSIESILTILKYAIGLGLFGLFANYILVAYNHIPELQQQPIISQVKQLNKTVADSVITASDLRESAAPLSTTGLRDPFAQ